MELHIQSDFDCAFIINGEFCESADRLVMNEFDVVYVTVLPLSCALLPYTVRLCGAQSLHTELADGIKLSEEHYVLSLLPRRLVIYGNPNTPPAAPNDRIARLFALVKSGDDAAAYAMLSETLKTQVKRSDLCGFFDGYDRIVPSKWEGANKFYLIDKNGCAHLHTYSLKDEFIDDIVCCD